MPAPLEKLDRAALNPRQLARKAIKDPQWLGQILRGLDAESARTRYGCANALRVISEERPDLLYPRFDFFARLLDHENNIFQWEAAYVLSQLAKADPRNKLRAMFETYFAPIRGPVMITAANVIQGGARIAQAKPEMADRIAAEILKVPKARYQTPECLNVALGHALAALDHMFGLLQDPAPVRRFARSQLKNPRAATRKKAERLLRRIERDAKHHPA